MTRHNPLFADISSNNPHFDAAEYAAAGHVLIAIKATEGVNYVNPYHRGWALRAGMHHIAVVHYHFARPDLGYSPEAEADHFLHGCAGLLGPRDYLVLDLERGTPQGWAHDPAWSRAFDQRVRNGSRFRTILYSSRSVLASGEGWLAGPPERVWDADWSANPDYHPAGYTVAFRQYTDGVQGPEPHAFAGIGECDGNRASRETMQQVTRGR